jgi:cell division protein ZapA
MASVDLEIGDRRYSVACRDGKEDNLRSAAALVDQKAKSASGALGKLSEARQLLFASLMLADELKEKRAAAALQEPQTEDPHIADALERLAERMESLADRLESTAATP